MRVSGIKKISIALLSLLFVMIFASCERSNDLIGAGEVGFTFNAADLDNQFKSAAFEDSSVLHQYHLLVSILDEDTSLVYDKKVVPLYRFSNSFTSDKIKLEAGLYFISEFLVVNPKGEVVYASPKRNAPLAYLVNNPLPIDFKVEPDRQKTVGVEVLPVNNVEPTEFGYTNFGIRIVQPLQFYSGVILDNPLIMAPAKFVSADVYITDPSGWKYRFEYKPTVNPVVVRSNSGIYKFVVKAYGYIAEYSVSDEHLKKCDKNNPFILSVGTGGLSTITIKTSPDSTDDALITDLNSEENYGNDKSFMASFKSEPVLTVMRTTRSLMNFHLERYLPKSATIKKVELQLTAHKGPFVYDTDSSFADTMYFTGILKPIVEPWNEQKVIWSNQPATTDANNVIIDYYPWMSAVSRTYDITNLFAGPDKINVPVYGFMFQHYPETVPGGMMFYSSDAEMPQLRPVIKIQYTLP